VRDPLAEHKAAGSLVESSHETAYPDGMPNTLPIGCTLPTSGSAAEPGALGALAQTAEALGFDSIWISDHVVVPERIESSYPYSPDGRFPTSPNQPYLDPIPTLSYLAGRTSRVRLGTHVLVLPYRHPLLTAKMIATLDNLSGGRIDFGIGVGWMREEFEALGQQTYDRRGAATDEQLRILKKVWTEGVTSYDGEFWSFPTLGALPMPVQKPHPPIWVGGHSKAARRRTAHLADGWLPIGTRPPALLPPDDIAAGIADIRAEATRVGRDPNSIRVCFSTSVNFEEDAAAKLRQYAEIGVQSFIVSFGAHPPGEIERRLRRFAEEVRPAIGAAGVR
jgi:probable F420-dependent oxidoreductase